MLRYSLSGGSDISAFPSDKMYPLGYPTQEHYCDFNALFQSPAAALDQILYPNEEFEIPTFDVVAKYPSVPLAEQRAPLTPPGSASGPN
ncbi:hypothetical protein BTUL_0074g00360 [Botrytis tulipae]|uniref:Uncharacterized protein n=1 Tax=Botrytis tulipae TaxID=87230 RepID=A0A4Z1EPN6_9HELO|nr:hypothetical protein BTUL_0074g00360 [Botrytis tulipae]